MKTKHFQLGVAFLMSGIASATTITDGVKMGTTNTVPVNSNSIAAGTDNSADNISLALGFSNAADNYGFAMGDGNIAFNGSISSGGWNTILADSVHSMALGEGNFHGYTSATMLFGGYNTMVMQYGSAAIGISNSASAPFGKSGASNILIGELNEIDQAVSSAPSVIEGTVLIGIENKSSSTAAFAFGKGNIAQTDTVTVGTYGQTVSGASLIVGKGTSDSARSNGLVVLRNGEVQIAGSLVVGGSPILTQGSTNSFLQSQGYFTQSGLAAALANTAPPLTSSAWTNAFVLRGFVSGGGVLAVGAGSNASNSGAIAIGNASLASGVYSSAIGGAVAGGSYSTAIGDDSWTSSLATSAVALGGGSAMGTYSLAAMYGETRGDLSFATQLGYAEGRGSIALSGTDWIYGGGNIASGENSTTIGGVGNVAGGFGSFASGYWTKAPSAFSVVLGSMNAAPSGSATGWVETDVLFQLGNGWAARSAAEPSSSLRSNAINTLKNGQTTLTNKAWKANPNVTPTASNSNGEALVVEGNTRLQGNTQLMGKVTIAEPQGDISMGDYQ